jgi:BTB/POZ domain-containing protein 13
LTYGEQDNDDLTSCSHHDAKTFRGRVKCHNKKIDMILRGYWLGEWISDEDNTTGSIRVVGLCMFCNYRSSEPGLYVDFNITNQCLLHRNKSSIMCSKCDHNFSPSINCLEYSCIKDENCVIGLVEFVLVSVTLLIILLLFIFIFDFFPASGSLNALVFFAQMTTTTLQIYGEGWVPLPQNASLSKNLRSVYLSVNGIWKLDFVYSLNNFCLFKNTDVIEVLYFRYVVAVLALIPVVVLVLIAKNLDKIQNYIGKCATDRLPGNAASGFTYVLNCGCFRMFDKIFRFDNEASMKTLVASCLLLSFTEFTVSTFYLMAPTALYNETGEVVTQVYYYNPGELYKPDWTWLVVLMVLAVVVIGLPSLLIFLRSSPPNKASPNTCNRCLNTVLYLDKFLNLFFLEPYQKDLKSGYNRTCSKFKVWRFSFGIHDHRWYAGWYFILRATLFASYIFSMDFVVQLVIQQIFFALAIGISILVRPYKTKIHNRIDAFILLLLLIVNFTIFLQYYLATSTDSLGVNVGLLSVQFVLIFIPPTMMMVYFFIKIYNNIHREKINNDMSDIDMSYNVNHHEREAPINRRPKCHDFIMRRLCGCSYYQQQECNVNIDDNVNEEDPLINAN